MKLRGRTNKGKNRIRELGDEWILAKNDPDFEIVGDEA